MKLEKVIQQNSVEKIKSLIAEFAEERCVDIFIQYVLSKPEELTEIEKDFVKQIKKRLNQLLIDMYVKYTLDRDNMQKTIENLLNDGFWGYSERDLGELLDVLGSYSDYQAYPFIKACLEESHKALIQTKEEEQKERTLKERERIISNINYHKKSIESNEKKLQEIQEKIK